MREMAGAWQMSMDKRLGLFSEDVEEPSPLAAISGDDIPEPNPPNTAPHQIWTQVSNSAGLLYNSTTPILLFTVKPQDSFGGFYFFSIFKYQKATIKPTMTCSNAIFSKIHVSTLPLAVCSGGIPF